MNVRTASRRSIPGSVQAKVSTWHRIAARSIASRPVKFVHVLLPLMNASAVPYKL